MQIQKMLRIYYFLNASTIFTVCIGNVINLDHGITSFYVSENFTKFTDSTETSVKFVLYLFCAFYVTE